MLRLNVLSDETLRNDVLELVNGVLRSISRETIVDMLKNSNYLEKRIDEVLKSYQLATVIERWLKTTKMWESQSLYQAIIKAIEPKIKEIFQIYEINYKTLIAKLEQLIKEVEKKQINLNETRVREIVTEELIKRLSLVPI